MFASKLKTVTGVLLVLTLGLGGGLASWQPSGHAQDNPEKTYPRGPAPRRPADNLAATLLALNKHYWETTARGDAKELAKFLADDFVSISVLGRYGKGDAVTACQRHRLADWKVKDPEVIRVSKDAAVLTSLYDCKLLSAADGRLLEDRHDCRVTLVWANRDGGWVIVFCEDDHGRRPAGTAPRVGFEWRWPGPAGGAGWDADW